MWQARVTLLEWSPTSSASSHERKQWLKAAVFSGSKKSLDITQVVSRRFPHVLHTEKERSRERKRTIAAVKETEKPQHCIDKRPKLTNDVSLKTKAYPELCFDINFHFSWWAPLSVVKHFSLKKFSQRIVFFTRARNRGEYGGTTVSGRIPTKWCSHLSERKFSFFVAFQSLKKILFSVTPERLTGSTCGALLIFYNFC